MSASTPESRALALFRAGRWPEAESAWREVLARDPEHADALHVLGFILARTGRREEGMTLVDRSIERDPGNPGFLNNRAILLSDSGRLDEALADVRRAVEREPRFLAGYCHLGSLLRRLGRHEEALAAFHRALLLDPRSVDAHVGLGNVLRSRGERAGAAASFQAALALDPSNAPAHYNLGCLRLDEGDARAAESSFRRALDCDARNPQAWTSLAAALMRLGRSAEARAGFERALALQPGAAEALNGLGVLAHREGAVDEAIGCFARALEARPGFVQALVNWGNALKDRGDFESAESMYRRALEASPEDADALNNLGNVALERGDIEAARASYRAALEARPGSADPRYSLGQIALREQRFAQGWEDFELRFDTHPPQATLRHFAVPRLDADMLGAVRRVAVWREQGIGDQVLFSTLLPDLVARGLTAVVEVDARLVEAYRRSVPALEFRTPGDFDGAIAGCDCEVPIGSLPRLFRPDVRSFAAQPRALLVPDERRVREARAGLGEGRWLALSWRSFQRFGRGGLAHRKSFPLGLVEALAGRGVRLLDVQYGDVAEERESLERRHPGLLQRLPGLDLQEDLEGLMAALAACELVVTTSNATAHLAGAIGKRTWLLYLAGHPPFHYWAPRPDGRSLWYPSVEVLTDHSWTTWESALEAVGRRLEQGL